jgi:hypothetical protein
MYTKQTHVSVCVKKGNIKKNISQYEECLQPRVPIEPQMRKCTCHAWNRSDRTKLTEVISDLTTNRKYACIYIYILTVEKGAEVYAKR